MILGSNHQNKIRMKLTLKIEQDQDAESPREWDNAGRMVCAHRRYRLGDEQSDGGSIKELVRDIERKGGVWLPLYLYDHSGLTMNTTGFHCPWDSGQVGIIYILPETGRKEWGRVWRKKALACMVSEVETYDQFLRGDVWGYIVEDEDGNNVDSCWGFFGHSHAEEEGKSALDHAQAEADKTETETQLAECVP